MAKSVAKEKNLRTPIVCVMGHVDHGKTSLLDKIRGTAIVDGEAGAITQHIGATEVPLDVISRICGSVPKGKFKIPGLLFIDTPGHHAFTTLRSRGGALADLAIVIVDINEGFQPQTIEAINILKRYKTPFVIAANKIDRIHGWDPHPMSSFISSFNKQPEHIRSILDTKFYEIVGKMYELGFSTDRYDRIRDFQKTIAIIPISAKTGEGLPDILMVLLGLAQKFLESNLEYHATGPGVGVVLEVKEERGLGITLDAILYDGEIRVGDMIAVGTLAEPIVTKTRALLKPRPLSEIRAEEKFKQIKHITAAAGLKISAPMLDNAISGAPIRVVIRENTDEISKEIMSEIEQTRIETDNVGVIIRADTIGSLEALVNELKSQEIPIRKADVGNISRRDIIEAKALDDPLYSVILGFNVDILPDALDDTPSAVESANKAMAIINKSKLIGQEIYRASAYVDLAKLFIDLGQEGMARECIIKAVDSSAGLEDEFERSSIFQTIAETQIRMGVRTKNSGLLEDAVESFGYITREYYRTSTRQTLASVLSNLKEDELVKRLA